MHLIHRTALSNLCRRLLLLVILAALGACTLPAEILVPDPGPAAASTAAPVPSSTSSSTPAAPGSAADGDAGDPAAATCAPASAAGWAPIWVPPTGASQGLCAPQDLADIYAACFGPDATDDTCSDYESNSPTCASCVLSDSTDASWGPVVVFAETTAVNQPGCLDLVDPDAADCAQAAESQTECEHALCDASCPVADGPSFEAWEQCAAEADQGACGGYDGTCLSAALAGDAGGAPCGGADFATAFANVATIFCGSGS
ncbi:MAG TPA: hypothetical protein VGL81_09940 [Polyangiaceae bacterium]|jgi:hypothetical protein